MKTISLIILTLLSVNCHANGKLNCEPIDAEIVNQISRCNVPDGWLIIIGGGYGKAITFYPDKDHKWKLDK